MSFGLANPKVQFACLPGEVRRTILDWPSVRVIMRAALLLLPLLVGCAHERHAPSSHAKFHSAGLERSLQYWTANHSIHPVNHFYVYATDVDRGELVGALVYWREGGRILNYSEEPTGSEANAWRLPPKVDRNSLRSDETVSSRNEVVPHETWVRWMKQCIDEGKEYQVMLPDAKAAFPPRGAS